MVFSHHIPDNHVGVLNRAICRRPPWQPRTTGVLIWIVPGRILLIGMIGCHPEMLGNKVCTAADTGLRMGEGNGILARHQLVGNWLAHGVEQRGVGNQPGACRGGVKPLLGLLLGAERRSGGVEGVAERFANWLIQNATSTRPTVASKNASQVPLPALAKTNGMVSDGVAVGAMFATDWANVSTNGRAFFRKPLV